MSPDPFIYLQFIRQHIMTLPGTTEGLSHGTPAFYVNKKIITRLWENGEVLVVHTDEREKWMKSDPGTYFITDHYLNYRYVLVTLDKADPEDLKKLLTESWLQRATTALVKEYQNGR